MEAPPSTGVALSYPDSVDSSPRSRTTDSWDEPPIPSPKIRLMCSYGGSIVPRPTDKSLCYIGGETRIVAIDRHSSLSDLSSKLSRSINPSSSFSLKYQLPNEDLDSLISLTTDEDLENMVDEYDRIASAVLTGASAKQSSRIRLFLFPNKIESAPSSIGSLLDDSKSETWFVDALNNLLGLDDDSSSVHSRGGGAVGKTDQDQNQNQNQRGLQQRHDSNVGRQDVQPVPDLPMLETNSSFGSTSSAPSLSNLPPIRMRADDRMSDQRYANLDDHFQHMNLSSAAAAPQQTIQVPNVAPVSSPMISPTDNSNMVFESDEEKSDTRMVTPQQATNQQKSAPIESPSISDSRSVVYYQETRVPVAAPSVNPILDYNRVPVMDPATAYQMQQVQVNESGYIMPPISAQVEQHHPIPHPQVQHTLQQQQQQQFIPVHHLPPSYYQFSPHQSIQQSQQFDASTVPMYYAPYPQPQSVPLPKVAPKPEMQPSLYQTAAPQTAPMMHVPGHAYPGMVYHHPSQMAANYGYEYVNVNSNTNTMTSADTMQPQVYYTQSTSPPSMMPGQYQTVITDGQQAAEVNQNRAS